jgi:hypothetical protein
VPEVSIHKHGDTALTHDDVRTAEDVFGVNSVAHAASMELTAKRELSP